MSVRAMLVVAAADGVTIRSDNQSLTNSPFGTACVLEIQDYTFGVANVVPSATAAAESVGKVKFNELKITRVLDEATTGLFAALAGNAEGPIGLPYVQLYLMHEDPGGTLSSRAAFEFQQAIIGEIVWSDNVDGGSTSEQLTISYSAMVIAYTEQDASGALTGSQKVGWSLTSGAKNPPDSLNARLTKVS